eukprot:GEMP01026135.1.p1 GENE.GEMP01026135.1~~GEMP01026135.1.p1  ORF type:complete len:237 (+),score=37.74 GEMP01026135.1:35-745(+)
MEKVESALSGATLESSPAHAALDYAHSFQVVTSDIRMDPMCDPSLSKFDFWRCNLFAQNAFGFWKVRTLIHALTAMKAPVDLVMVQCPSSAMHRAGYSPKHHRVWMCGNHFWNPFEFRRVLVHELIHAFDFTRAKIDASNLDHIACTEVRAWNLSGECDLWTKWVTFLGDEMVNRKQRCIKEFTVASMQEGDARATTAERQEAVDRIFTRCFKDHWPFTTQAELDNRMRESPMINE